MNHLERNKKAISIPAGFRFLMAGTLLVLLILSSGCRTSSTKSSWNRVSTISSISRSFPVVVPVSPSNSNTRNNSYMLKISRLKMQSGIRSYHQGNYEESITVLSNLQHDLLSEFEREQAYAYLIVLSYLLERPFDFNKWIGLARSKSPTLLQSPVMNEFPPYIKNHIRNEW